MDEMARQAARHAKAVVDALETTRGWKLETGNWKRRATGSWKLETASAS
jgi:hypothetical protein